jgi:hypothetical protein
MAEIPDEVKAAIVLEVHSQLNPLKTTVDRLDRTVRSLYSNGSGGPPGYLETARAEDNEWKAQLLDLVGKHSDQLAETSDFVKTHNQADREHQERQKRSEDRWRFWAPKIYKGVIGAVVGLFSTGVVACHKLEPVIQVIWQDYLKEHPDAAQSLKNVSSNAPDKVYAEQKESQQSAGSSMMPTH